MDSCTLTVVRRGRRPLLVGIKLHPQTQTLPNQQRKTETQQNLPNRFRSSPLQPLASWGAKMAVTKRPSELSFD
jgi:hypothetical protein